MEAIEQIEPAEWGAFQRHAGWSEVDEVGIRQPSNQRPWVRREREGEAAKAGKCVSLPCLHRVDRGPAYGDIQEPMGGRRQGVLATLRMARSAGG